MKIKSIHARQILDSRGIPTVECDVVTEKGLFRASVPSGSSAGKHEALELRDGGKAFAGKAVTKAVENVNKIIAKKIIGLDSTKQREIDESMIALDGTENKSKLGANAILSVSSAVCKAGAASKGIELFEHISQLCGSKKFLLPTPQMVVISGGAHADKSTDLQEYMITPHGFKTFSEALKAGTETYHCLASILKKKGFHTNVGKEGSFAPSVPNNRTPLELMEKAIEEAGYVVGKEICFALDPASSEFFENEKYSLKTESKNLSSAEMIDYYKALVDEFPIYSLEDGLSEDDWQGWKELNKSLGKKIQLVGDDLLVTNVKRIKKAIEMDAVNAVLIKINQIGTISETFDAMKLTSSRKWASVVSHRSGETEESFIADLVVGTAAGQSKFGAPARSDRNAKYNQLLRIEEMLGSKASFNGKVY
jgi:enolase